MKFSSKKIETVYRSQPNVHVSYCQPWRPDHEKIAKLTSKHTPKGAGVLDIGSGVGHTLAEISRRRPDLQLSAADIDDAALTIVLDRVPVHSSYKIESIQELSDQDLKFDTVIVSHVLEHLHDPLAEVQDVMQVVSSGGIAILAVPNPVRPDVILGNLIRRHYVNRGHGYSWDRSHWINFLENWAGLDVVEYSQDFVPLPFVRHWRIAAKPQMWLAGVLPWFSFSNIAIVRKP